MAIAVRGVRFATVKAGFYRYWRRHSCGLVLKPSIGLTNFKRQENNENKKLDKAYNIGK